MSGLLRSMTPGIPTHRPQGRQTMKQGLISPSGLRMPCIPQEELEDVAGGEMFWYFCDPDTHWRMVG